MDDLPTGTVTFLFSDVEGSTRLAQERPGAWPGLLRRHQELLRAAFAAHGGHEVSTDGDSFFVAFSSATAAIAAAIEAQRALSGEAWPSEEETIRVRIGLHAGEAEVRDGTYVGAAVHRAARIAAAGHGGQVLVSDAVRALAEHGLPDGVVLRDLGDHVLKDLDRPLRLWQPVVPGLADTFPPLATRDRGPSNLPLRPTNFLGRASQIEAIRSLLADTRLLTLTGPGGTGKTRLALEVAARSLDDHPDGVWWIELTTIREPELVGATIAQELGLPDRGGRTAVERILEYVGERRMLIVLDNFEQVIDAAPVVVELLSGAPNLSILVTSRGTLHVYGEREYPVPPLDLPDPDHLPSDLATLSQYEAVALFIDRARAVKPDFTVTNENAPAVAEICVRLDGLPLAIELAAARIRILTPQAMLPRLADRLALLSAGARDLPERQQTLRGAIAWSHDLLDDAERSLFACLAVFVGGAGLEAIERVCGSAVDADVLDTLSALVDKSLVRQSVAVDGSPRFGMLETIREYATQQSVERGSWDDLQAAHAELLVEWASEAAGRMMSPDKRALLDRFEEDHDNLRAAIAWASRQGRADLAQRLVAGCWRFWQMRGYLAEGADRARQVLELPGSRDHPVERADALDAAGGIAYWQADLMVSRRYYEEEIELREQLGDREGLAWALYSISFTYSVWSEDADSRRGATGYIDRSLALFTELGDRLGVGRATWARANLSYGIGEADEAIATAHEALETFRALDDRFMIGWTSYTLGIAELWLDFAGRADRDLVADATRWMTDALRIFIEAGDVSGYTLVLDAFADIARRRGDRIRAATIAGAVDALERRSGTGLNLSNRILVGYDPAELRDDPELSEAWAAGAELSADEATAYALDG